MSTLSDNCVFCDSLLSAQPTQKLTEVGVKKIRDVCSRLKVEKDISCGQLVHAYCRKKFVDQKEILRKEKLLSVVTTSKFSPKKIRSNTTFLFSVNCFLCGEKASFNDKKNPTHKVLTSAKDFDSKIKTTCRERNDRWATEIMGRISCVNDLRAADAIYHRACSINFWTKKCQPAHTKNENDSEKFTKNTGRPIDTVRFGAFLESVKYCEDICEENEFCTILEVQKKMATLLHGKDAEPYSIKHLKRCLMEHFKDRILITTSSGLEDVIFLKDKSDDILRQFFAEKKSDSYETEKMRLITTAAKLLKSDCKLVEQTLDYYPSVSDFETVNNCHKIIPDSLLAFLNVLAPTESNNLKKAAIGQALLQMTKGKNFLSPLQVALGVQLHFSQTSKKLIDILHKMGFSISYAEVLKYERNAAITMQDNGRQLNTKFFPQFVADNVDHNLRSIDGKSNFHGMGIVSLVTPVLETSKLIPRNAVSTKEICQAGRINISFYDGHQKRINRKYSVLPLIEAQDVYKNLDLLWKMSWLLSPKATNWSGMMQLSTSAPFPGKSSIFFSPIIDLNPSDFSCIYTTLEFVAAEAQKFNVDPVLTFDQPLFWKASVIIDNEPETSPLKRIVLRLGGFHTIMSYLGCIGHFMEASGIEEVMSQIYGANTVQQILTGHHVSRAIRAFMLLDAALNYILIRRAFEVPLEEKVLQDLYLNVNDQRFKDAASLLAGLIEKSVGAEETCKADVWCEIEEKLINYKNSITAISENAKLWFQFIEMVSILRQFLRAERTGNWLLHLKTLQTMLPYFAAAGHSLYLKSARLYLQSMLELPETHPDIHTKFMDGFHVGRRSDRYWAGLSTDLLIEQVLMRNLKSTGGLTRGSGFSEARRVTWLLGMPACADVNSTMMSLLNLDDSEFENHRDCTNSRQLRDLSDLTKLITTLNYLAPFEPGSALRNLFTGKIADTDVNVHKAEEVGKAIMKSMDTQIVSDYSFKKSLTVKTMSQARTLQIDGESVKVDPYLLFQRLLCIVNNKSSNMEEYFGYELCTYPMALSDENGFLRSPKKSDFSDTLSKIAMDCHSDCGNTRISNFVIDGGHLLHLLPWPRHSTYKELFEQYSTYLHKHYKNSTIVFDNYANKFTPKSMTHLKRSNGKIGPIIDFKDDTPLTLPKNVFLSNDENKQKFLITLAKYLEQSGFTTVQARDDADLQIVLEALKQAEKIPTLIIGKDTDLIALAVFHFNDSKHKNLFISGENQSSFTKKPSVKLWNVKKLKLSLGRELCDKILLCHAFLGCDCTSRIYSIHKGKLLHLLMHNEAAVLDATVFCDSLSSKEAITKAGERILVRLYGGKETEPLNAMRVKIFHQKISASSTRVKPEMLPPTLNAAKFHFFRVFLQVMTWMGQDLNPEEWGWKRGNSSLLPIWSDKPPAPEALLKIIRCACKEDACFNHRCSCKKHGIQCSFACKGCQGVMCCNKASPTGMTALGSAYEEDDANDEDNDLDSYYYE